MPNDQPYDDNELFLQVAAGNEAAFTQLFHIYTPKLLPFVTRLTRDDQQAKEVIQETFLRLWLGREDLPKVKQPASWLFRIASNVSINYLRSKGNQRKLLQQLEHAGAVHDNTLDPILESKELNGIIHAAVAALPDKRRQIYRLSREQGLSHQQIADELGLSINTVKNQIGIALKFIQEQIHRQTGLSLATLIILWAL